MTDMRGPLEGIRVIEAAYFLAGPYCGSLLAALGAEVIKVEAPGIGDPSRIHAPFAGPDGMSASPRGPEDLSVSILKRARNKKSVTLNLKSERGKQIFLDLARRADVVLENFQPGTMSITGHEGAPPVRAGFSLADQAAPLFAALAVVSALRFRERTGLGQNVDVAMLDCLLVLC